MYPCLPLLLNGSVKMRRTFELCSHWQPRSPTIIFFDEVDSMLGQRTRVGEHEAMRKIKNEFMAHWDGLLTKPGERILVLAATNRPFDLDEAIIRRFERRYLCSLRILNTELSYILAEAQFVLAYIPFCSFTKGEISNRKSLNWKLHSICSLLLSL